MELIHKAVFERVRRACPDLKLALYDPGLRLNAGTSSDCLKRYPSEDAPLFTSDGGFGAGFVLTDGWRLYLSGRNRTPDGVAHILSLVRSIEKLVAHNQQLAAQLSSNQDKMSLLLNRLFSLNTTDDIAYTAIAAVSMGFDMTLPRVICLFRLKSTLEEGSLSESTLQSIVSLIESGSKMTDQDLIGRVSSNQIVLCKVIPDSAASIQQHCHPVLSAICASLMELYPISVQVGVGEVCRSLSDYSAGFLEISQLLRCQALLGSKKSFFYTCDNQFELEMLRLPLTQTAHFLSRQLEVLERSPQFLETIEALLAHNMNISDAADHLFVHHNTVIFRINRIKELLGLDPLQKNRDLALLKTLYMYSKLKPLMSPDSKGYIPPQPELTID